MQQSFVGALDAFEKNLDRDTATNFISEHKNPRKQLTPMHLHFARWQILVHLDP